MTKAIIAVVVVLALAGGGYYYWQEAQKVESTDDAEIDGSIVSVSPRVAGHVKEVLVEDQQLVHAGDVLVRLDTQDFELAIARAKAEVSGAAAGLETSKTDVPLTSATTNSVLNAAKSSREDAALGVVWAERQLSVSEARLASAQANVKAAEANATKAAQDVERYRGLVAKDMIPRQLFDQAVAALEATKAAVDAQKAQAVEAQQQIAASQMAIQQAKARVGRADAEVENAMTGPQQVALTQSKTLSGNAQVALRRAELAQEQLNLTYTTIVAPVTGIVGRKTINPGQNVLPGQQMMAIVPLDGLYVTANFKETQLRKMKPGQKVTINVDAYGRDYTGKIERIGGASGAKFSLLPPENATGNFVKVVQRIPVRISLDAGQDPDHLLRPGMSVVPTVQLAAETQVAQR